MIRCLHCGAETSNGLALCELCQRAAGTIFEFLPVYFRNLARWRPGRAGSRDVPGSRVLYDGAVRDVESSGDRISDKLDAAMNALTTWARALVKDRPHFVRPLTLVDAVLTQDLPDEYADMLADDPAAVATLLCAAFEERLTSIATLDWCGEFVREMSHHESVLRAETEASIPGWYAGACRTCGNATYVVPGFTWVTCNGITGWTDDEEPRPIRCGATTYARDHLAIILDEARDWVARPKALAEAIVALVDTEMSVPRLHERIKKWEQRDKLTGVHRVTRGYDWDEDAHKIVVVEQRVGYARYRFGDVFDMVMTNRRQTRHVASA